jgi:hypothetical protein
VKRVARFSATRSSVAVAVTHAIAVDVALFINFEYWGSSPSVTAGKIQRFLDLPTLRVCEWLLNRPELPVWWVWRRHAFLIREMFVFDVVGGLLYGAVTFVVLRMFWKVRVDESGA